MIFWMIPAHGNQGQEPSAAYLRVRPVQTGGASLNNSESQIQWIYHHDQDMTHAKINSKKPLDLKSNVGPARTELKIDPLYAEGENGYMKGGWHNHIRVQK